MSSIFSLNGLLSNQKSRYVGNGVPERVHCLPISAIRQSQISPSHNWGMHRSILASVADQTWRSNDPNSGWLLKRVDTRINPDATAKNNSSTSLVLPKLQTDATLYRLPLGGKIYDVSEISSGGKPLMRAIGGRHKGSLSSYFALLDPEPSTYGKGNRPNSLCAIGMSEREYRQAFSVLDNTAPGAVSQCMLDWHRDPKFEKFPEARSFLAAALDPIDKAYREHVSAIQEASLQAALSKEASTDTSTAKSQRAQKFEIEPSLLD